MDLLAAERDAVEAESALTLPAEATIFVPGRVCLFGVSKPTHKTIDLLFFFWVFLFALITLQKDSCNLFTQPSRCSTRIQ